MRSEMYYSVPREARQKAFVALEMTMAYQLAALADQLDLFANTWIASLPRPIRRLMGRR